VQIAVAHRVVRCKDAKVLGDFSELPGLAGPDGLIIHNVSNDMSPYNCFWVCLKTVNKTIKL